MSIHFQILGTPEKDNALHLQVDSGQSVDRLLFDCGEGCLATLPLGEIQALDHLFLSHLHMDHICGFDSFFRCVYNRTAKPNHVWGPPQTSRLLQHRFQSYLWNLHTEMQGTWLVTDILEPAHQDASLCQTTRYELTEAFATAYPHAGPTQPGLAANVILDTPHYTVQAYTMDHKTPSIAYVVREKPSWNVDVRKLAALGLKPGAWVKELKNTANATETLLVNGHHHDVKALREGILVETAGDSVAYLTDFLLTEETTQRLAQILHGCGTIICEGQYRHADLALAKKHHHMTTVQSAQLAKQAQARKLVLFHLSARYTKEEWGEMLAEAKAIFPATHYPPAWTEAWSV